MISLLDDREATFDPRMVPSRRKVKFLLKTAKTETKFQRKDDVEE